MRHKNPQDAFNKSSVIRDLDHAGDLHDDNPINPPDSPSLQDTAANDRFIPNFDLEINFEPPDDSESATATIANTKFYRRVVTGLGLLLVVGVLMYYVPGSFLDRSPDSGVKQVAIKAGKSDPVTTLEEIGNNIILANRWQFTDINKFASIWDNLNETARSDVSKSIWFEQFSFKLERQATDLIRADIVTDPSISLARKLGLIELRASRVARRKAKDVIAYRESTDEYDDAIVSSVDKEITSTKEEVADKANIEPLAVSSKRILENAVVVVSPLITAREIKNLLNQYSKGYIYGDVAALRELYINFDDEVQRASMRVLMQDYKTLLENSTQRWVEFKDLSWVHNEGVSIGTGYITMESTLHNRDRKSIDANVLIKLSRDNGRVKIAGFNLSNQKTALMKFEQPRASVQTASDQPSLAEVQTLVARYVRAYEEGDISSLGSLFAKNVISNKGTTKAELNQEYVDLFASSRTRQMNIQDLRWKFSKKRAKGVGTMKVIVEKDREVSVVKGKIQFVAKKIDGKMLITHLYQLEHSD